jgi:hypothetical protein
VAPGPLITSIRSTSSSITSCWSQRAEIAYCVESMRATCRFGARRSASGRLVTPERRMSSLVMT